MTDEVTDVVTNEGDDPNDLRAEIPAGGAAAAPAMQRDQQAGAASESKPVPYAHAGAAFTEWFNNKARQLVNPTIDLGTKKASVVRLHPDGRLECNVHGGTAEEQQTFVAFEPQYLDQLVRRIGAIGL